MSNRQRTAEQISRRTDELRAHAATEHGYESWEEFAAAEPIFADIANVMAWTNAEAGN